MRGCTGTTTYRFTRTGCLLVEAPSAPRRWRLLYGPGGSIPPPFVEDYVRCSHCSSDYEYCSIVTFILIPMNLRYGSTAYSLSNCVTNQSVWHPRLTSVFVVRPSSSNRILLGNRGRSIRRGSVKTVERRFLDKLPRN